MLWAALALLSTVGTARADIQDTVVVVRAAELCGEVSPELARGLADKASRDGDYQRAGQCYLAAGQEAVADQAFIKASTRQGKSETSKRLASNLTDLKASAHQMKLAFQHR